MEKNRKNKSDETYYKDLAKNYLTEARRFVPKYDELVKSVIGVIISKKPKIILDIGFGVGNIEKAIVQRLKKVEIMAIDSSQEMMKVATDNLKNHSNHIKLIICDAVSFAPEVKFDCIFSNMTLHNVSFKEKIILLQKIKRWLKSDGFFVWGDLIRHKDRKTQERFVNYRRNYGLKRGGSVKFADRNFKKEELLDFPLTIEETFNLLKKSGFKKVRNVWNHDTFSNFYCEK